MDHQLRDASKLCNCFLAQLQPCSTFLTTLTSVSCTISQLFVARSNKASIPIGVMTTVCWDTTIDQQTNLFTWQLEIIN